MSPHANFLQRRPLGEARALLLAGVAAVAAEEIAVDDALGRIAAETVLARHPSPHYRASGMDGIAVRSRDTWKAADGPLLLRALTAASPEPAEGDPCCVPVDTGSLLPAWTDAVIRIEDASAADGGYRIRTVAAPGRDVRRAGEDIDAGSVVVPAGARIRAWDIGALLATGTTAIRVRRRPRIAIVATGSEVVEPSGHAGPGQVIEYNSRVIAARIEECGGSAHRLGIVADDEKSLRAAIADAAARFDAVCVIAGSSAGRRDFTIAALGALGDVFVHGVDIAPGRPVALAHIDGSPDRPAKPAIAIPGYPVAAVVVCEQFVKPLLAALLGSADVPADRLRAHVVRKIPSRLGVEEFRRICLVRRRDGGFVVAPLPSGAGAISSVSGAHAWLRIDSTTEGIDAGADVDVELLVRRDELESALVLAGAASGESASLEAELRRTNPAARVLCLRLGDGEVLAAVGRGEAHAALVEPGARAAEAVAAGLLLVRRPGAALLLAVAPESAGAAALAPVGEAAGA